MASLLCVSGVFKDLIFAKTTGRKYKKMDIKLEGWVGFNVDLITSRVHHENIKENERQIKIKPVVGDGRKTTRRTRLPLEIKKILTKNSPRRRSLNHEATIVVGGMKNDRKQKPLTP